jgi:hypothetical protein
MPPILNPAPDWKPDRSEYVTLWHGCTAFDKAAIEMSGIDLKQCAVNTDFGRGFYTTTYEKQARHWAWRRYYDWRKRNPNGSGNQPVTLRFRIRRFAVSKNKIATFERGLDKLVSLAFIIGDYDYEDYWSFVQHCRQSTQANVRNHRRRGGWYDLVSGPIAAFWDQRVAMDDSDQLSFHTKSGIRILDALIQKALKSGPDGDPDYYTWSPVV